MSILSFLSGRTRLGTPVPSTSQQAPNSNPFHHPAVGGYALDPYRVRGSDVPHQIDGTPPVYDFAIQRVPVAPLTSYFLQTTPLPTNNVEVKAHGVYQPPTQRDSTDHALYGGFVPTDGMYQVIHTVAPVIILSTPINRTTNTYNPDLLASNHAYGKLNIVPPDKRKTPRGFDDARSK